MENVVVVIGAGQIGQAIARRVAVGKHVVLADRSEANANAAAEVMVNAGYHVSVATVDVSSRETVRALVARATDIGDIVGLIHAAGVSPSQASPETILHVDLYGTAVVLEEFGKVMGRGGSGVVISSQSGHRLPALSIEQNKALAMTPTEELLKLPFLHLDQVKDSLHAYQLSKRGNSLRVMAEAVRWGTRGARINTITPIGCFPLFLKLPAALVIGIWAIVQFMHGFGALTTRVTSEQGGGTAYFAHIGGFVLGVIVASFFAGRAGSPRHYRYYY